MAVNKPTGDNARKGAVRKRSQLETKVMGEEALDQAQQGVRSVHGPEGQGTSSRACARRSELAHNRYRLNHDFALRIFDQNVLQLAGFNALAQPLRPRARAPGLLGRAGVARRARGLRRSPPRSVSTLRRSASMRLITFDGSRSRGASIFWPDCFFFKQVLQRLLVIGPRTAPARSAPSWSPTMCVARSSISFGDLLVGNIVEIFVFLPHLVGIAQRHAEHALAARFERDDVLARREHHLADRDHSLLADGLADHGERLLADLAIRHDVVRVVEIELVDLLARHELVDLDRRACSRSRSLPAPRAQARGTRPCRPRSL